MGKHVTAQSILVSKPDIYQQALRLHREGKLEQAEKIYRDILTSEPEHAGSLHFLGVILLHRKEIGQAILFLEQAITLAPKAAFEKAVARDPAYADAISNLGLIALQQD